VVRLLDYKFLKETDLVTGKESKLDFPVSDVLQFYLEDGSKVSVRPSGTEPKIKFYISVLSKLRSKDEFAKVTEELDKKISGIEKYLQSA
jgi:phosphoglucomutase